MPKPYSADLRERVLVTCERAVLSRAEIARRFQLSEATVYNWLRQLREEDRRTAKPHAGGPQPKIDPTGGHDVLRDLVAEDNAATLAEYVEHFFERTGRRVSRAVMCQTLKALGLRRKKDPAG